MALDTIGESLLSSAGCQTVSKARDMSRDMALISCLALRTSIHCWESRSSISRFEWPGLKPNWWSEIRPLEKRKDLMSETMMDSITLLMIGRRLIGLSLQGSAITNLVLFFGIPVPWSIFRENYKFKFWFGYSIQIHPNHLSVLLTKTDQTIFHWMIIFNCLQLYNLFYAQIIIIKCLTVCVIQCVSSKICERWIPSVWNLHSQSKTSYMSHDQLSCTI